MASLVSPSWNTARSWVRDLEKLREITRRVA